MYRRQLLSDELRYDHQTSPRKSRTQLGQKLINTTLYSSMYEINKKPTDVIGKRLIPWNGESIDRYSQYVALNKNEISEFDIANITKQIYRIIYIDDNGYLRSKPSVDKNPNRLNIFLTTDNIIRHIAYF